MSYMTHNVPSINQYWHAGFKLSLLRSSIQTCNIIETLQLMIIMLMMFGRSLLVMASTYRSDQILSDLSTVMHNHDNDQDLILSINVLSCQQLQDEQK